MRITEITVSWQETAGLGDYSNVRPGVTLTATLDEGDDPAAWREALLIEARRAVQEQVDQALEAMGKPAKWSAEPRYDVRYCYAGKGKIVLLVPTGVRLDTSTYPLAAGHRLAMARRIAADCDDGVVYDCADGNLEPARAAIAAAHAAEAERESF